MEHKRMKIEYVPISRIKPYENNPRFNDDTVPILKESIENYDFRVPLLLTKDLVVITGHTRLKAAKELGMTELPCVIARDMGEKEAREFRLVDNKVAEASGWDFDMLGMELGDLKDIGFDAESFGFLDYGSYDDAPPAPDDMPRDVPDPETDSFTGSPAPREHSWSVRVFCDTEEEVEQLRSALDEMGYRHD